MWCISVAGFQHARQSGKENEGKGVGVAIQINADGPQSVKIAEVQEFDEPLELP